MEDSGNIVPDHRLLFKGVGNNRNSFKAGSLIPARHCKKWKGVTQLHSTQTPVYNYRSRTTHI